MSDVSMNEFVTALNAHTKALNAHTAELAKIGGASKSGASTGGKTNTSSKKSGPSLEDVQAKFGDYMSVTDKAVRKERSAWLKALCAKYKVERISEVAEDKYGAVLSALEKRIESEESGGDEDEGDEDDSAPI